MNDSPTLETTRLNLRWLSLADAPLMLQVWNNPDFMRYVGDRGIRTPEQASKALASGAIRSYEDHGYGPFHIALKDGEPIGISGLFKRDGLEFPDIGFALLPDYYGRGYAKEATEAVLDWCNARAGLETLFSIVSPNNRASISLIEKLGFELQGSHRLEGDSEDVLLYRLDFMEQ